MRQRWVATIIRLSGYIYKKKSGLLTAHSVQSFVDVILIIVAEIVLAIISLPLYVVSKPISSQSSGVVQYKIRRVVTLSVLFALLLAWMIKLGFLLVTESVIIPANPVTISETQVAESDVRLHPPVQQWHHRPLQSHENRRDGGRAPVSSSGGKRCFGLMNRRAGEDKNLQPELRFPICLIAN